MAKILKIDSNSPEKNIISEAVEILINGGIIATPTETRYGLLGRIDHLSVLKKIYGIKNRDFNSPCAIFLKSLNDISEYGFENEISQKIAQCFLPGPLTLILKNISNYKEPIVTNNKIGIRISSSPVITDILEGLDFPLTATSANLSGQKENETVEEIAQIFGNDIDLYLDSGPLNKLTSTVVECINSNYNILRTGPITGKNIENCIEEIIN